MKRYQFLFLLLFVTTLQGVMYAADASDQLAVTSFAHLGVGQKAPELKKKQKSEHDDEALRLATVAAAVAGCATLPLWYSSAPAQSSTGAASLSVTGSSPSTLPSETLEVVASSVVPLGNFSVALSQPNSSPPAESSTADVIDARSKAAGGRAKGDKPKKLSALQSIRKNIKKAVEAAKKKGKKEKKDLQQYMKKVFFYYLDLCPAIYRRNFFKLGTTKIILKAALTKEFEQITKIVAEAVPEIHGVPIDINQLCIDYLLYSQNKPKHIKADLELHNTTANPKAVFKFFNWLANTEISDSDTWMLY